MLFLNMCSPQRFLPHLLAYRFGCNRPARNELFATLCRRCTDQQTPDHSP
jgi:hypothetical protein